MKTLTLELREETVEWLSAEAERRGLTKEAAATDLLERRAWEQEHGPISDEDIAAIDEGIADADAGRVFSSEEVWASLGTKE